MCNKRTYTKDTRIDNNLGRLFARLLDTRVACVLKSAPIAVGESFADSLHRVLACLAILSRYWHVSHMHALTYTHACA
jgi:hypothetical protein